MENIWFTVTVGINAVSFAAMIYGKNLQNVVLAGLPKTDDSYKIDRGIDLFYQMNRIMYVAASIFAASGWLLIKEIL